MTIQYMAKDTGCIYDSTRLYRDARLCNNAGLYVDARLADRLRQIKVKSTAIKEIVLKKIIKTKGAENSEKTEELLLVSAAIKGDKDAYRLLIEKYESRLIRCAFDVVKDSEDAKDIVQDALVKAYLSLPKFRGESSFYTWMYRIVFHLAIDHTRKRLRRGGIHEDIDDKKVVKDISFMGNEAIKPDEQIIKREEILRVQQALESLSEEHRQVVIMREIDGFSYDEIGTTLGISLGTVMSRLFYARKSLQKMLSKLQEPDIKSI